MTTIPQVLSDERAMRVAIKACDSLNITRVHGDGKTRTICDDAGLLELVRAVERAVAEALAAPSPVAPVLPAGDALPSERSAAFLDWWHEHGRKLCITPECAEYVFEAGRAALSKQVPAGEAWKPIETAPPLRKLIVAYKNSAGKWRRVLATYWPAETRESEHSESGWADEGWYEATEAYEELAPLEGDPVCWVAMPPINDASVPSALSQSGQADSTGDAK